VIVSQRTAAGSDKPFLWTTHCATMREAIDQTWGWDEDWQRTEFVRRFNAAAVTILEVDGADAGCLWLESRPGSIYVTEIQVLSPFQRKGLATSILRELQSRADARDVGVALAVLQVNDSARRLYERLGFTVSSSARQPFIDMRYGTARLETFDERLRRVLGEEVVIEPYDARWPELFQREQAHLHDALPAGLVRRIEHFGSTAVPGLAAKPVVDMLVEVADLELTKEQVVPILEAKGYDYFWRPTHGDDGPPFYAWFIRRDPASGRRTHHIHMVEPHFEQWQALLFRDYLRAHADAAREYEALKRRLAEAYPNDRLAYTREKTSFVTRII
jgi:GrpB-like predicted nucleotidyltransferase (UPF0157 family)/ribosomal protein S18 acetylase RimI-like enzyme